MVWSHLSRRAFLESSLATSAALVAGCKNRDAGPVAPEDKHHIPETFTTRVRIRDGQRGALHERIEAHQFPNAAPGIHFARLVIEEPDHLIFSIIFDGKRQRALDFLAANGKELELLWELCEGYQPGTASDPDMLRDWVKSTELDELLLYFSYRQTETAVRRALGFRDRFNGFLRDWDRDVSRRGDAFRELVTHWRDDLAASGDVDPIAQNARQLITPASETRPFTMITQLKKGEAAKVKFMLTAGEWAIEKLDIHPLKGMTTLHYARFALLPGDRLFFASVYDGEWIQYLDDFGTRIPKKLDKAWGGSVGYPERGAADIPGLTQFLESHRLEADAFYGAYLDRTVKQINSSLALMSNWKPLAKNAPTTDGDIADAMKVFVADNQLYLG